jgi:hypothetical protein
MTYDVKNVFYLSTGMTLAKDTDGATTAQLDLSAYIDPIQRGRAKGTGLAIYKVHWDVSGAENGDELVPVAESGAFKFGVIAGAGFGDNATGVFTPSGMSQSMSPGNALSVYGANWYGPDSMLPAAAANHPGVPGPLNGSFLEPSEKVPYVVVRDNVCIISEQLAQMQTLSYINVRLECAQISLDQATLNQLLRTQTV